MEIWESSAHKWTKDRETGCHHQKSDSGREERALEFSSECLQSNGSGRKEETTSGGWIRRKVERTDILEAKEESHREEEVTV